MIKKDLKPLYTKTNISIKVLTNLYKVNLKKEYSSKSIIAKCKSSELTIDVQYTVELALEAKGCAVCKADIRHLTLCKYRTEVTY